MLYYCLYTACTGEINSAFIFCLLSHSGYLILGLIYSPLWRFAFLRGFITASRVCLIRKNKLDDRIKWLNRHTGEYLWILKEMDEKEELEEIYQKIMEETGESQIFVTNADERFMKNDFAVSYNLPKAVNLENHLIRYFKMAN